MRDKSRKLARGANLGPKHQTKPHRMNYDSPSAYTGDIPRNTAIAAHNGTSFVPERRADSAIESYAADLAATYKRLA